VVNTINQLVFLGSQTLYSVKYEMNSASFGSHNPHDCTGPRKGWLYLELGCSYIL